MNDKAVNGQRSSRKNFLMEEQLEQSLRGTEGVQDFVPTRHGKVVSYSDPLKHPDMLLLCTDPSLHCLSLLTPPSHHLAMLVRAVTLVLLSTPLPHLTWLTLLLFLLTKYLLAVMPIPNTALLAWGIARPA